MSNLILHPRLLQMLLKYTKCFRNNCRFFKRVVEENNPFLLSCGPKCHTQDTKKCQGQTKNTIVVGIMSI